MPTATAANSDAVARAMVTSPALGWRAVTSLTVSISGGTQMPMNRGKQIIWSGRGMFQIPYRSSGNSRAEAIRKRTNRRRISPQRTLPYPAIILAVTGAVHDVTCVSYNPHSFLVDLQPDAETKMDTRAGHGGKCGRGPCSFPPEKGRVAFNFTYPARVENTG